MTLELDEPRIGIEAYPTPRAGTTPPRPYFPEHVAVIDASTHIMTRPWLQFFATIARQAVAAGPGNVIGPSSAVAGHVASYGDTTGTLIADSGLAVATLAAHGVWTDVPFAAGNFTAAAGTWTVAAGNQTTFAYTQIGGTLIVTVSLSGTTLSAATSTLYITLPLGASIKRRAVGTVSLTTAAGKDLALALAAVSATQLAISSRWGGTLPAGTVALDATVACSV